MRPQRANPMPTVTPKKRCAVYTRKSTDEGLDQEYNSLEAQRDAGLAFIASQRHEGWIAVGDGYDDGGYSGGNVDRPALRRLMVDIEAGHWVISEAPEAFRQGQFFISSFATAPASTNLGSGRRIPPGRGVTDQDWATPTETGKG